MAENVKTFTKKDIAHSLLESQPDLKLYQSEEIVDNLFNIMREMLMDGQSDLVRIEIRNFGVFEV
ncbi:MAG: HU family DNA-binding protein, partial [Candidatus Marinimicrobia bacterium]|nr:HU family DNA-binding protein [Candidatus Neomarinimicrobiota bacterium]